MLLALAAAPSQADDYGGFIEVESEEDLRDLLSLQEIDEEEFETLREMLEEGVNLQTATRDELYALPNLTYEDVDAILAFREEAGGIPDPAALVTAGVLDERKLLSLAPFIIVEEGTASWFAVRGRARMLGTWVVKDEGSPPAALTAQAESFKHLKAGLVAVLTRQRLGDVRYDPNRGALSAEAPSAQFHLPKFYLEWKTPEWHLLAGTYRIGFGQRLTFDNTTLTLPNGIRIDDTLYISQDLSRACRESEAEQGESPCAGDLAYEYQTPDYRWTDRLRGAAVGLRRLETGSGWLQAYGFFSYQTRSIYQYEIYDRERCPDPTDDDNPDCAAPWAYKRQDDLLAPTSRFSYQTLPDMYNEMLGGANLAYFFDRRTHIGVTGYGAGIDWLVEGMQLDFQEWSRTPYGGPFGAVGVDAALGIGVADLGAEVTRSLDSQPAGGGFAALVRSTFTFKKQEFEASLRYFDDDFANPYARPIAAADEYDGLRARDETGLRLRYSGKAGDWQLRSLLDFWVLPSTGAPRLRLWNRADVELLPWFRPGVWLEYQDRDVTESGRGACFEVSTEMVEGEPVPCSGEKVQAGVALRFYPLKRMTLALKYQHRFLDDGSSRYANKMRQDMSLWLTFGWWISDDLKIAARLRYLNEAFDANDYLEQSAWFYLEGVWRLERALRVKLRYELYAWLDDRASTEARVPNPAHWLRLELEARF